MAVIASGKVDDVLDLVEMCFLYIEKVISDLHQYDRDQLGVTQDSEDAIEELNQRFAEHAIGYQYVDGQIIRIDSQLIHEEIVKPALTLIHDKAFAGAEEEFRKAHEHFRHERYKESVNEALKAFESVAKTICAASKWELDANATASKLIDKLFKERLIPNELQSQFTSLRSVLESGVPTVRNRMGGHGQGQEVKAIPKYLAGYVLHMTASAIVFLVEAHNSRE